MSTESNSFTWLLVIIVAAVLFFTNPSLEKHQTEFGEIITEVITETKIEESLFFLGGKEGVRNLIISGVNRNNYLIISFTTYTTFTISDESSPKIVGIGVLGKVYIFNDVKQKLISIINAINSGSKSFLGS